MFSLLRSFGARRMTQLVRRAPTTVCMFWHGDRCRRWSGTVAKFVVVAGPRTGVQVCVPCQWPGGRWCDRTGADDAREALDALFIRPLHSGSRNAPVACRGSRDAVRQPAWGESR